MSLILEALQRSEQEHHQDATGPGIRTQHPESALDARWTHWLLPGVAVLLLAALVLLVAFGMSHEDPTGAQNTPTSADTAAATAAAATTPAAAAVTVPAPGPTASEPPAPAHSETESSITIGPVQPGEVVHAAEVKPAPPSMAVAKLYQRATAPTAVDSPSATPATSDQGLSVEAVLAAARRELLTPRRKDHPIPLVQDLPQATKDEIPSIFFNSHSWSGKTSERMVTLNGKTYREGDTVLSGVRLIEILPEAIVLDFRGTRFRLNALNSWVNL